MVEALSKVVSIEFKPFNHVFEKILQFDDLEKNHFDLHFLKKTSFSVNANKMRFQKEFHPIVNWIKLWTSQRYTQCSIDRLMNQSIAQLYIAELS